MSAGGGLDFLAESNICGQTLLRIVSRGSSIIAELLRLTAYIPPAIALAAGDEGRLGAAAAEQDPGSIRYRPILFDFRYLKTPEMYDKEFNTNAAIAELDEEFYAAHEEVLARFYRLFESMVIYIADFNKYLAELAEGFYIQHTIEGVMLDTDGKQLVCEALYLLGVMLILADQKAPGPIRERIVVAHYRHKGEGSVPLDQLTKLVRDSGYRHGVPTAKRPANYPEEYLSRFAVPAKVVAMALDRLRSDDVYNGRRVYPAPEHRSFALAGQAPLVYMLLYLAPRTLNEDKQAMRELVAAHFRDNWVIQLYMGEIVDLSVEWERYKAAREALALDTLQPAAVKAMVALHRGSIVETARALEGYLVEGVMSEAYVVDNVAALTDTVRLANISLRWALLHRRTEGKKWREIVCGPGGFSDKKPLLEFLLRTSLLEYKLKAHVKHLLAVKGSKWAEDRTYVAQLMAELSEYFSGSRALTRVEKDEGLMGWFKSLQDEVSALDYGDGVLAGRKIRQLIKALDDVTSFDVIDATPQVKDYLVLAKERLTDMVRTVNISERTLADIDTLTDFSYAWGSIAEFVSDMHDRIRGDPAAVTPLRTAFLKLASVLDVPLVRITQAASPDAQSVAEYYSGELVAFLRTVMEVVPVIVFSILREVIVLQARNMSAMPVRMEFGHLKDSAQLEQRAVLARKTHEISVFTEGVLAMQKTLLGVIQVDPRQILTDGIRKHLVEQISRALHACLAFDLRPGKGGAGRTATGRDPKGVVEEALVRLRDTLGGYKSSFEYVQDYIRLYGLRMWQEEFTRITAFATEQEANRFTRKKILPELSRYQSKAIPLPLYPRAPPGDASPQHCVTFVGRLLEAVLTLTEPARAIYGPGPSGGGWYEPTGRELAGAGLFLLLNSSVGVTGLMGLDRLLGLTAERDLTRLMRGYAGELKAGAKELLRRLGEELQPLSAAGPSVVKTLLALAGRLKRSMDSMADGLTAVGHAQLLRKAVAHELRFSCRLDSNTLCGAVEGLNSALLGDIRAHHYKPESHPLPAEDNPLLASAATYCEAAGINDPLTNIYIQVEGELFPTMGLWLTMVCVGAAPRLGWDVEFGTLVRRKAGDPVDGGPFAAGLITLLKQMHPAVTDDFLAHMGQYLRSVVSATVGTAVAEAASGGPSSKPAKALASAPPALPTDALTLLQLLQMVARTGHIPDRTLHSHVPAYLFDTIL